MLQSSRLVPLVLLFLSFQVLGAIQEYAFDSEQEEDTL